MNLKKIIFGIFVFTIAVLSVFTVPTAFAYSFCDTSYVEPEPGFGFQYKVITPTDYTITGGEFLSICVEPDYLWYTIYLDVKESGSLTVTIPKDAVDLKQFNYESCYPDDLGTTKAPDGRFYDYNTATVKQISETKDSRVLEFSWSKPISQINYFGTHAIVDGVNYSEPKWCIGLVESGQRSAEINPTVPLSGTEKQDNEIGKSSSSPCKSGLVSVIKHDSSKSACVKHTTAEKLIQRGWALPFNGDLENDHLPTKILPRHEPKEYYPHNDCFQGNTREFRTIEDENGHYDILIVGDIIVDLNYNITSGQVDKICKKARPDVTDEGVLYIRGNEVMISLTDVTSHGTLTIEVPWDVHTPNRIPDIDHIHTYHGNLDSYCYGENNTTLQVVARNTEYQTLQIPIKPNSSIIHFAILDTSALAIALPDLIDAIKPSNNEEFKSIYLDDEEHIAIEPFDKRIDGNFVELCPIKEIDKK